MPSDCTSAASPVFGDIQTPTNAEPRDASVLGSILSQPIVNALTWLWMVIIRGLGMAVAPIGAALPGVISADATTDAITLAGHGLVNNDPVRFFTFSGTVPVGLSAGVVYFVVGGTANTFQVSATVGGAAINITAPEAGSVWIVLVGSPDIYLPAGGNFVAGKIGTLLQLCGQLAKGNIWTNTNTYSGSSLFSGPIVRSGATARLLTRPPVEIPGNADITIDTSMGDTFYLLEPTANRVVTIRETTAPPPSAGEQIRLIKRRNILSPASGFTWTVTREGGAAMAVMSSAGGGAPNDHSALDLIVRLDNTWTTGPANNTSIAGGSDV